MKIQGGSCFTIKMNKLSKTSIVTILSLVGAAAFYYAIRETFVGALTALATKYDISWLQNSIVQMWVIFGIVVILLLILGVSTKGIKKMVASS